MTHVASSSTLRVRYAETDQMGVAYHGNYFAWFEVGRTDLLRTLGYTYKELEAEDCRLPVIAAEVRFLKPALYDDVLETRTRLRETTGVRVTFEYDVCRSGDGKPLANAMTTHAAVDGRGRPRRLPSELRRRLA